jgi:hypothetical protein
MTSEPIFKTLSLHEYDPQLKREVEYWDVQTKFGDKVLATLMRGLVRFRGTLTSSFVFASGYRRLGDVEAHFRITLPKGLKDRFESETGIILIKPEEVTGF